MRLEAVRVLHIGGVRAIRAAGIESAETGISAWNRFSGRHFAVAACRLPAAEYRPAGAGWVAAARGSPACCHRRIGPGSDRGRGDIVNEARKVLVQLISESDDLRLRRLSIRATESGYRLVSDPLPPHAWQLLDADDGAVLRGARTLDEIEQWLDE